MSLRMTLKNHLGSALLLTSSAIIGSWILWRRSWKKQRKLGDDQMTAAHKAGVFPEGMNEEDDAIGEMTPLPDSDIPGPCVLYHPLVFGQARATCTPNHWHNTYWLRYVAVMEQEPRCAIIQHTDTHRYHVMIQLPVEQILACDDCSAPHEVFRLPVEDHYAYFVFVPQQDLDGFALFSQAQEAAQSLFLSLDLHRLLPGAQTKSISEQEE